METRPRHLIGTGPHVPNADISIVQLPVNALQSLDQHPDLDTRLAPLRDQGVLIVGSGNIAGARRRAHPRQSQRPGSRRTSLELGEILGSETSRVAHQVNRMATVASRKGTLRFSRKARRRCEPRGSAYSRVMKVLIAAAAAVEHVDQIPIGVRHLIAAATEIRVMSPSLVGPLRWLAGDVDEARYSSQHRLDVVVGQLADAGRDVTGERGDELGPTALDDALRQFEADHVIVGLRHQRPRHGRVTR